MYTPLERHIGPVAKDFATPNKPLTKKDPPKVEEFVNPGAMGDGMDAQADENIVKNSAKREIIIEDLRKD